MIQKMYSVYDDAIKDYRMPHFCLTHGEAEREFRAGVNNPKAGHLHNSPEQFTLFYHGEWNTEDGSFAALSTPQAIIKAIQVKETTDNVRTIGA